MKTKITPILILSITTAVLVAGLSAGSLILSFQSVRGLAARNGFNSPGDFILAGIIDGFIIIASVEVLRATLQKEGKIYAWFLIGASTVGSVFLNVIYAPVGLMAQILHAVPPITLALSFHLLIGQFEGWIKRHATLASLADIGRALEEAKQRLADIAKHTGDALADHERNLAKWADKLKAEQDAVKAARKEKDEAERHADAARAVVSDILRQLADIENQGGDVVVWRRDITRRLADTGMPVPDIARIVGVSDRTVQRDLLQAGDMPQPQPVIVVSKNGHKAEA